MTKLKKYTVIGVYADNLQRWADTFEARSPEAAEKMAKRFAKVEEGTEMIVAAVLDGDVKVLR